MVERWYEASTGYFDGELNAEFFNVAQHKYQFVTGTKDKIKVSRVVCALQSETRAIGIAIGLNNAMPNEDSLVNSLQDMLIYEKM